MNVRFLSSCEARKKYISFMALQHITYAFSASLDEKMSYTFHKLAYSLCIMITFIFIKSDVIVKNPLLNIK